MDYHGVNAATDDGSKVLGEQGLPRKVRWDGIIISSQHHRQ